MIKSCNSRCSFFSDTNNITLNSRIKVTNDEIEYDENNTAVFYALLGPLEVMNKATFSLVDGDEDVVGSIKDFQNINCGVWWEMCATHGKVDKFQVNFTIINTEGGHPVTNHREQPSDRVTLADFKKWYKGFDVSTQDGGTTYTAPSSYYTDYDDFSSSDCHKFYKIILNKI